MLINRSRLRLGLSLLLLTPLLIYWAWDKPPAGPADSNTDSPQRGVDYFMQGVTLRDFSATGQLQHTLTASTLSHRPAQAGFTLTNPHLDSLTKQGRRITLSSQTGFVSDDQMKAHLHGDVQLQMPTQDNRMRRLKSEQLDLDQQSGIISSPLPVTLTEPGNQLSSTGIIINYNQQTTELLANVKGLFHEY